MKKSFKTKGFAGLIMTILTVGALNANALCIFNCAVKAKYEAVNTEIYAKLPACGGNLTKYIVGNQYKDELISKLDRVIKNEGKLQTFLNEKNISMEVVVSQELQAAVRHFEISTARRPLPQISFCNGS